MQPAWLTGVSGAPAAMASGDTTSSWNVSGWASASASAVGAVPVHCLKSFIIAADRVQVESDVQQ
jgi:hypothetical protein